MKRKLLLVIPGVVALAAVASSTFVACEDDDVGVACCVAGREPETGQCRGSSSGGEDENIIVNSQAMDCRSRLCLLYGQVSTATSLCTTPCEDADDCPDPTGSCPGGFACRIGQTQGGLQSGLQCCKLCVCRDHVTGDPNDDSASENLCKNKPKVCPNI